MSNSAIIELASTITCPNCGHQSKEQMPTNSCQFFWECPSCETLLKPKEGDCCVFCSYGDVPCPPIQEANKSGGEAPSGCSG
ncbi:MAG: GDCCVxC domain-containing (seleno)protein [Verrucomicrobia bacterium]|nr:GDCCVxC domain-containing (seleno)protein [Verrucomicrobiota bacterium]MDA1069148.1 GDCCVxC domain-containing (seleno)protein [Verrucomicrobiota bacterium]